MFVLIVILAWLLLHVVLPNVIAPCSNPDVTVPVVAWAVPSPLFPALSPCTSTLISYVTPWVNPVNV